LFRPLLSFIPRHRIITSYNLRLHQAHETFPTIATQRLSTLPCNYADTQLSMLVTRQCDTGRNTWSSSKLEAIYRNAASPRMSNFEPLSTQPDWREQYSAFSLPGENGLLQPSFDQPTTSNNVENTSQHSTARPTLEHRHSLGPIRQEAPPAPIIERPDSAPGDSGPSAVVARNDSLVSTESAAISLGSLGSNPLSSASSAPAQQSTVANSEGEDLALVRGRRR
jgi:hypothetical protein